jgi:Histidine kinase
MSSAGKNLPHRAWIWIACGGFALALGIAKVAMPFDDVDEYVAYRLTFTACCFLGLWPITSLCRFLSDRNTPLWATVAIVLACSYAIGFICSTCALLLHFVYGKEQYMRTFSWTYIFNGSYFSFFILAAASAAFFGLKQYEVLQRERHRLFVANALMREAELSALRYQLQPHFLFNTLNAISTLVREGDRQSATLMITRLGDFLRATLDDNATHEVTLQDEIVLTRHYLEIEKVRFGDRLSISIQIADAVRQALVPNLFLQPLIENAIRHGIAPSTRGGQIVIKAFTEGSRLLISVQDDGAGKSAATSKKVGIGLENTRARLDRLYPSAHTLDVDFPATGGCIVTVALPLEVRSTTKIDSPVLETV